jgi:hypothetical protein
MGSMQPKHRDGEPAVAALGQPAGVELRLVDGLDDGQRLEQGLGVEVVVAEVHELAGSSPVAVTSRTVKPRWLRWIAMDAAAETAVSRDEAMPWPRCARSRLSRKSVARDCHGCSSRRTISSPTRAELRQCTRRRSSRGGTRAP